MRKSTDLDTLAVLEEVAPHGVITCSDASIAILRRGSAGNDASAADRGAVERRSKKSVADERISRSARQLFPVRGRLYRLDDVRRRVDGVARTSALDVGLT